MQLRRTTALLWVALALLVCYRGQAQGTEPTRVRDVIYRYKQGVALTLDVFKPEKPNGIGVIWMVSGGWVSNHDSINPGLAKIFTNRGQTVFQVVHGAQPRYTVSEIVQDIHRAVRFIRTHAKEYSVDPDRLGIAGGSAGGHLSLMMAAYGSLGSESAKDPVDRASSRVQAVAIFFPPTDFLNYGKEGASALEIPVLRGYWPAFGLTDKTTTEEKLRLGKELSPIYGVTKETPPTLIIHGDADTLVPIQQSERIIAKMKECGVECRLEVRKGKGHGWPGMEKEGESLAEWFEQHLAKK